MHCILNHEPPAWLPDTEPDALIDMQQVLGLKSTTNRRGLKCNPAIKL